MKGATMKKVWKRFYVLSIAMLVTLSLISFAYADTCTSAMRTINLYGHQYEISSIIDNGDMGHLTASTRITSEPPHVPTGYMGVQPRLYNASGTLYTSGAWKYNTSPTRTFGYGKTFSVPNNTYFYSQGAVDLYNGDGYSRYFCTKTPNYMSKPIYYSNEVSVECNDRGEIFGPQPVLEQIDVMPDLVLAMGLNGETGYVRATDLDAPNVSTPEQAEAYMEYLESEIRAAKLANQKYLDTIPLYDADGVTVIGEFAISFPDEMID